MTEGRKMWGDQAFCHSPCGTRSPSGALATCPTDRDPATRPGGPRGHTAARPCRVQHSAEPESGSPARRAPVPRGLGRPQRIEVLGGKSGRKAPVLKTWFKRQVQKEPRLGVLGSTLHLFGLHAYRGVPTPGPMGPSQAREAVTSQRRARTPGEIRAGTSSPHSGHCSAPGTGPGSRDPGAALQGQGRGSSPRERTPFQKGPCVPPPGFSHLPAYHTEPSHPCPLCTEPTCQGCQFWVMGGSSSHTADPRSILEGGSLIFPST